MTQTFIFLILCIILIIILTGAEYAYLASNRLTIELKRKQGKNSGRLLGKFFDQPERFWSGTLISFYLLIACSCFLVCDLVEILLSSRFRDFIPLTISDIFHENQYLEMTLAFVLSMIIILSPVGIIAKKSFENHPESKLNTWASFIDFICNITTPIANLFVGISEFMLKYLFNVKINKKESIFERINTKQFVRHSLQGQSDGEENHKELFEKALQLSKLKLRKCMTPRNEITAVEINTPITTLKDVFVSTKLSKIVIYEDSLDNVIGYVHHIDMNRRPATIKDVLHPILAVPETMTGLDLLHTFTKERKSIAWVIDEFGGTAGFVSMEDVLEEIFGDIRDEYDTDEYTEKQISPNQYILSGRLSIDYLNEKYDLNIMGKVSETLSGYIINHNASIPKQNDRIIVQNFEFEILSVSETRIDTVKLKVLHG